MEAHDALEPDPHGRGLHYDLAVLRSRRTFAPPRFERRGALKLLGGASLGLLLAACGSNSKSASTTTAGATSGTTGTSGSTTGTASGRIPEETGGPYPGDGSNGPNVLTESGVVRRDIRPSFGDYNGTAKGVDVGIDLTIVKAADGSPYSGAAVYIWHCTAEGGYSLYSQGITDQNFLRGVQEADADGKLSFTSIYPAVYDGRWPHIHFEVYDSLASATSGKSPLVTSQIALLEDASRAVYASDDRYSASPGNLDRVSLSSDMVFSDGVSLQTPTMSGTPGSNLRMALKVAV